MLAKQLESNGYKPYGTYPGDYMLEAGQLKIAWSIDTKTDRTRVITVWRSNSQRLLRINGVLNPQPNVKTVTSAIKSLYLDYVE